MSTWLLSKLTLWSMPTTGVGVIGRYVLYVGVFGLPQPVSCFTQHCWVSPMHPTAPHTCLRDDQWLISLQNGTFALDTGSLWGLSDTYIPSGRTLHTVPLLHLAYHIGHLFHKEYHITTYICITYCNFLLRFLLRWH